jgi:hypothetical protein
MTKKTDDGLQATDDANTVDSEGHASTPLHEAMTAAVEATEDDDGSDVDESSAADDDTQKRKVWTDPGISSDTSGVYDTRKATPVANIFQQYASTPDARVAAEQFTPKRFDSPGGNTTHPNQFGERLSGIAPEFSATTDHTDNAVRIVGGDSQELDGNALRSVEAAISEATRANFDTSALQQQAAAIRSNVLNVRAAAPVLVPLMPLAKTPTPAE